MFFSFIIPVYNRPVEIKELLESLSLMNGKEEVEIVIVEDGSEITSEKWVNVFKEKLNISYYFKENSGPGSSRNFGMEKAKGDYFIILDSDCLIPPNYLENVKKYLSQHYVDCFGGPDAAHDSFSTIQKAINSVMTSFFTTGGIRGRSEKLGKFQPRSFNMGLSKKAFDKTGGFGNIHPGEDPDLSIRLWQEGFETALIPSAFVFHKRRIDWSKFYTQINKFGKVRPILNQRYPSYSKWIFWLPSLYLIFCLSAFISALFQQYIPLILLLLYNVFVFIETLIHTRNIAVAANSLIALNIQFFAYGIGFLKSNFQLKILKKKPEEAFPKLFFQK